MKAYMISAATTVWIVTFSLTVHAQWPDGGHHGFGPDDLNLQTIAGRIVVDSSGVHPVYYLDEDRDGEGDVLLMLGPWWYEPETGAAWPVPGSETTVLGYPIESGESTALVVFEIDGVTWRMSSEYGMKGWNGGGGWMPASDTTTVQGLVLVDTSYFYRHFYLDVDQDSLPDYRLVFGPDWYEAPGVHRPEPGSFVTVLGSVQETLGLTRLIVYELNGEAWRNPDGPAPWAGGWMERDHVDTAFAYCVNDSASWLAFAPGNTPGGMGQMHWPDSMFVQFWRVPPDSLPGKPHASRVAGFFADVHDPLGESMMGRTPGGHRGMMTFAQAHTIHLNYQKQDGDANHEAEIRALVWNEETDAWDELTGYFVDVDANTVSVNTTDLGRYYLLVSGETATRAADDGGVPQSKISLPTNYPNPFHGVTTITYDLPATRHVRLTVFDLTGRRVASIVDAIRPAGIQHETFDSAGLPSGLYIYQLESDGVTISRPMIAVD